MAQAFSGKPYCDGGHLKYFKAGEWGGHPGSRLARASSP